MSNFKPDALCDLPQECAGFFRLSRKLAVTCSNENEENQMIVKLLRRIIPLSGLLLLSMSVVGQSVLAASPKAVPPGGHHKVTKVLVDDPDDLTSITITGEDFDIGPGPLVVALVELGSLSVISATGTEIVATLPASILGGDFLLTVSTGEGQSQKDEYDRTIGPVGPQGSCGRHRGYRPARR